MGKRNKPETAQDRADAFDLQVALSVAGAADKRREGLYPYDLDAKLADISTGRETRRERRSRR